MGRKTTLTVENINEQLGELAPEDQKDLLSLVRKQLIKVRASKIGRTEWETQQLLGHKEFTKITLYFNRPSQYDMENAPEQGKFHINVAAYWFKPEDIEDESHDAAPGYSLRINPYSEESHISYDSENRVFLKSSILSIYDSDVSRFFFNDDCTMGYIYVPDDFTDYATLARTLGDIQKELINREQKMCYKELVKAQLIYKNFVKSLKMSKPRKFSVKECEQMCVTKQVPQKKEKPEKPKDKWESDVLISSL